jgi:hypothetical protein
VGSRWPYCEKCLPGVLSERRARQRENDRKRKIQQDASRFLVDKEKVPQIPVAPLSQWLKDLGVPESSTRENAGRIREFAEWLGVADRQLFRWRNGEAISASLDTVDRCLCHAGVPEKLRELWPDLYAFDDEMAVA